MLISFSRSAQSFPLEHRECGAARHADPQVRVTIIDPKAHVTLWGFTEHVATAILQTDRDKNLKAAVNKTVEDLQLLLAPQ